MAPLRVLCLVRLHTASLTYLSLVYQIAMMAKVFDETTDSLTETVQINTARQLFALERRPLAPAPLNIVSTACTIIEGLSRCGKNLVRRQKLPPTDSLQTLMRTKDEEYIVKNGPSEEALRVAAAQYIREHEPEQVQQARWRTKAAKKNAELHRDLLMQFDLVHEKLARLDTKMAPCPPQAVEPNDVDHRLHNRLSVARSFSGASRRGLSKSSITKSSSMLIGQQSLTGSLTSGLRPQKTRFETPMRELI